MSTHLYYKLQKGVHITLLGTGLDVTTAAIQSDTETIKFRMQPWTINTYVEALVRQTQHPDPQLVMDTIQDFPILEDLCH